MASVSAFAQFAATVVHNQKVKTNAKCQEQPGSVGTLPVIDLRAWSYSGSGNWLNSGSGGSTYDMSLGNGSTATTFPTYVSSSPNHFLMDGGDYFRLVGAQTAFLDSIHKANAIYTIVIEGHRASTSTQVWFSTGSWSNNVGVALYTTTSINYQVGDGSPISGSCGGNASLCVSGPSFGGTGTSFMALAVDEPSATGTVRANGSSSTITSTYSGPSAATAQHKFELGGVSESIVPNSTRYYRVRVWDVALTAAQIRDLYSYSGNYCPWY
ncbi:MAG: hypothetical protein IT287_09800 [Bdellovibrionaceae bacterium]|nr:hypothetical protein [Pseudobdellovibrionaceae bacterium]